MIRPRESLISQDSPAGSPDSRPGGASQPDPPRRDEETPSEAGAFQDLRSRLFGSSSAATSTKTTTSALSQVQTGVPTAAELATMGSTTDEASTTTSAAEPAAPRQEPAPVEETMFHPARADTGAAPSPRPTASARTAAPARMPAALPPPLPAKKGASATPVARRRLRAVDALLVLAALSVGVLAWLVVSDGPDGQAPQRQPTAGAPSADTGASSGIDGSPDVAASPHVTASSDVTASSRSMVRVGPDGVVTTSESLHFAQPVTVLDVVVPDRSGVTGVSTFHPKVSQIQLFVEGQEPQSVAADLTPGQTTQVTLAQPTRALTLQYAARGVVHRDTFSSPGRASALVTPLRIDVDGSHPRSLDIRGRAILNVGCYSATQDPSSCGSQTRSGWKFSPGIIGPTTDVLAQVDLGAQKR